MPKTPRRLFSADAPAVFFWLCAALVLLFRAAYIAAYPETLYQQDSKDYFFLTTTWDARGYFLVPFIRTPAYPVFLFIVTKLFGLSWVPLAQHLSLALCLIALGWVMARLHPAPAGRILAGIFLCVAGFSPSQFSYASQLMSEGVQTQVFVLVLCAYIYWRHSRKLAAVFPLAALCALDVLLRSINGILVFIFPLCMLLDIKKKALKPVCVFFVTSGLCLLPWMAYNARVHGRFAISNQGPMVLATSYGHLVDLDSGKNRPYKEAIRETHESYMKARARMSAERLLRAGIEVGGNEGAYASVLIRRFHLNNAQAHEAVRRIVLEGVRKHPCEALALFFKRLQAFYTNVPGENEGNYAFYASRWAGANEEDWILNNYRDIYRPYGLMDMAKAAREARYQAAGPLIRAMMFLSGLYLRAGAVFLWASILLFPAVLVSRHRHLGIVLFVFIHGYALLVCLVIFALPRFYQPLVVPILCLLALECMGVFEVVRSRKKHAP